MDILSWTATEVVKRIKSKEVSCLEVVEAFAHQIEKRNPEINAVVAINEEVFDQARAMDQDGHFAGKLSGLPIGVKDLFCTKGLRTTASSKILENFTPPYTATCVDQLQQEGALVLAKLNMDEFAMGSSNENSIFGPCKNPWNLDYVPGGSSGGSAAAVAAALVPVALGSDTGGSIRQPAHFCGVTGVKPTYGSVSRFGMIAFASSLDQAGVLGQNVEDCGALLDVMVGKDSRDGTSLPRKVPSLANLPVGSLDGVRFGCPKEYFQLEMNKDCEASFKTLTENIKSLGGEIVQVSLPHTEFSVSVYYLVATSEASSNLSRYDGVRYGFRASKDSNDLPIADLESLYRESRSQGFGEEVQRRILLGTYALSSGFIDAYYKKASQVRRLIHQDFTRAFEKCDYILTPVATSPAFKIGEKVKDPLAMYFNDVFTVATSLAGLPAMSLPVNLSSQGLPIGVQMIAPAFQEHRMLSHGKKIEEICRFSEVPSVR